MAACGNATKYAKVGLVFHILGTAVFVAGFASNAWMASQTTQTTVDITVGLFKMSDCSSGSCDNKDVTDIYKNGSRSGTIAMMAIALVGLTLALVMYSVYVAQDNARGKCYAIVIICWEFVTALFIIIGMIIWLTQIPSGYFGSYSLGLAVLGAGCFIGAGCLLIADVRQIKADRIGARRKIRVTPPPNYTPPPKYQTPIPTIPEYQSPRNKRSWDDQKFHVESSLSNSPPSQRVHTPRTPRRVRVQVRSETPVSMTSSFVSSNRRYGTPKYSQRYDRGAR